MPAHSSAGVVDQHQLLLTDGLEVGATPGGLVCIRAEPPPSMLHVMEALQKGNSLRRPTAALDASRMSLLLPPMEPDPGSAAEDLARESGRDSHHPIMAIGALVPNNSGYVNKSTNADSKGISATSPRKRTRPFREKSDVVTHCMEHKQQALMAMGTDDSVITMWDTNKAHKHALTQQAGSQLQYIQWALAQDINPLTPVLPTCSTS